jgi:FkbM family methyltransferase
MSFDKLRGQWRYLASNPAFQKGPLGVLSRLLIWRLRCALNSSAEIHLPKLDLSVFLPPQWHGAPKLIYVFRDEYETHLKLLPKFLGPGKVMIDVGANYGFFSLISARLVGEQGTVVAFEPAKSTFEILERNLELNGSPKIKALRMALSDKPGKLRLYHNADASRNSLAQSGSSQGFEEVEVRTLDSVVQELRLARIDFIKIDAEGADELVCRGGLEVLKKYQPAVFFEQNYVAASRLGLKGSGTAEFLAGLGYEFHVCREGEIIKSTNLTEDNILALRKG